MALHNLGTDSLGLFKTLLSNYLTPMHRLFHLSLLKCMPLLYARCFLYQTPNLWFLYSQHVLLSHF